MSKLFIPPVFVFICCIFIVLFYFLVPGCNLIPYPFNLCGVAVTITGFAFMGRSRDLFKKHQTTLFIEKSSHLITEGVFSKTRNPMYIGMFLLLLGLGICFRNLFSILTAFGFILLINFTFILKEEKMMTETFGKSYLDYKRSVKRWI